MAKLLTFGATGIKVPQNAFGALPVQRVSMDEAVKILRRAYEGGMRYFDTARAYSDSEEKIGEALSDIRKDIYISTKTMAADTEGMKRDLDTSLKNMKTDYVDIYQFHCAGRVIAPEDGSGMYELMEDFKRQGLIRHIGITAHKIGVAEDAVKSGLYETLQFPFSYLSGEREEALVRLCRERNVGYLCMKGLAGGLITDSKLAFAYISQFDNALPIWGIQKMSELEEWLSYMDEEPVFDEEMRAKVQEEKAKLSGEFCRGCGYCMPCPKEIEISSCARMSLMVRRAPSKNWVTEHWQQEMDKIKDCVECGLCKKKCPYELDIPNLLRRNYEDYEKIIAGEIKVD